MHRFIEHCVDMRKGRTAKKGLMQYKNIAQSILTVINMVKFHTSLLALTFKSATGLGLASSDDYER